MTKTKGQNVATKVLPFRFSNRYLLPCANCGGTAVVQVTPVKGSEDHECWMVVRCASKSHQTSAVKISHSVSEVEAMSVDELVLMPEFLTVMDRWNQTFDRSSVGKPHLGIPPFMNERNYEMGLYDRGDAL